MSPAAEPPGDPEQPDEPVRLGEFFEAGQQVDFTGEQAQGLGYEREPIPPEEQTRRAVLIALGVGFVLLLLLQLGFALALDADRWARVGPVLNTFSTVFAGGIGGAFGFYFAGGRGR